MKFFNICLTSVICILFGCNQNTTSSKNAIDDAYISKNTDDFNKIEFYGNIRATIEKSPSDIPSIHASSSNMHQFDFYVKNKTLRIACKHPIKKYDDIPVVKIHYNNIEKISSIGSSKISANNIELKKLFFYNNGASRLNITGQVENLFINSDGAFRMDGSSFKTINSSIQANGLCQATIDVTKKLNVSSKGINKILFRGNPKISKSGNGYNLISPLAQIDERVT